MKYITLIIGLLVAGCGKQEKADTANPVKELTLEEKVVGTYEFKYGEDILKLILLENEKFESYVNGEKDGDGGTWKMVGNEVHVAKEGKSIPIVYKIEPNGDLTAIAEIIRTKREDLPKEDQMTVKKIK